MAASKLILISALTVAAAVAGTTLAVSSEPAVAPAPSPASSFDAPADTTAPVSTASPSPTPPAPSTTTTTVAVDDESVPSPVEPANHDTAPVEPTPPAPDDDGLDAAFDFTPLPPQQNGGAGHNAADSFAPAPSCSHQCITKGVAYAHANDVEIVVETNVPAQIWISVVATIDGEEEFWADWTTFGHTSHSWLLEDLVPGVTYYVMAAATDDNQDTSHAWGEFTLP